MTERGQTLGFDLTLNNPLANQQDVDKKMQSTTNFSQYELLAKNLHEFGLVFAFAITITF